MRYASLLVLATVLAGCQTIPSTDTAKSEVGAAIQSWLAAFNSCDVNKATALYAADAVVWAAIVPTIISSPAGVREYFESVCSPNPQPKVAIGDQLVRVYGDTAINTGTYTFTVFPGGQSRLFPARFSFTYRKVDGQWLIVDHHSSALPAELTPTR